MKQPPRTRLSYGQPLSPRPARRGGGGRPPSGRALLVGGVALALLLGWLLFLPPLSLLRGGDGFSGAGDALVRERSNGPRSPEGYEFASAFYEVRSFPEKGAGASTIWLPLAAGKAGKGLTFFGWEGGRWDRLGPADVAEDGLQAVGEISRIPSNIAVLKRSAGSFRIQGILPTGANLNPDGEKLLSMLSPADYVPAPDGAVNGSPTSLAAAESVVLAPVIRASATTEIQAVNSLLSSETTRNAHVEAIVRLVQANKLDGIDIEYPAIAPNLGPSFTAFVAALAEQLHRTGKSLTVAVPLPRREGGTWNTLGYDWREIGKAADAVRLLPERDQSIYRRVMRDGLTYVTGLVDPKKLVLTVSPYAAEKSEQGVRTLSALDALTIAGQITVRDRDKIAAGTDVVISADNLNRDGGAAGLIWNAQTATVSFDYQSGDATRQVWIENAFSAAFKLELVQLWGLGGVAVEDASDAQGNANIWPAISQCTDRCQLTLQQPNAQLLRPQWKVDARSYDVGKAVVTWKAPEAGDHTVSLVVGDGAMRIETSTRVTLRPGSAAPTPSRTPSPTPTGSTGR